ncbi:FAD-linked sulfhydryl oxidase ALR [Drosophila miranda]|uniref:FAD-linked sulfhydryl oxidase ALR n=1 Tax=Drosophila miranda TaxID=7229 RepID=UPI0007E76BA9|nr:FAD-linked sulfhydryl oxidase ALR [Drosophila miranda]
MRLIFMTFTIVQRSFKISGLLTTSLYIQRERHYLQAEYTKQDLFEARRYVRQLQRSILRILRDPHSIMSETDPSSFRRQQPEHGFASHRQGKPDSNCRTCNDFKSWSKQQRIISNVQNSKDKHTASAEKLTVNAAELPREDCPLDKVSLGISTWGLLHTMAAFYSDNPTDNEKRDMKSFFEVLSRLYPCEFCAKDFRTDLTVNPINVNSQKELSSWLCMFHNRVNDKLGKPLFDCSKVNERWRDGWLDGSCD